MPGLTDEQMAALEASSSPQPKRGLTDQEMSALEAQHSPNSDSGGLWDGIKHFVGAVADAGANTATLGYLPDVMNARANLVGGETGDQFKQTLKQEEQQSPTGAVVGKVVGSIPPALAFGGATGAASDALGLSGEAASTLGGIGKGAGRIALNTAMAGTQGYVTKPEDGTTRGQNAALAALIVGGLSAVGELAGAATSPAARIKSNLSAQKDPEAFSQLARNNIADTRTGLLQSEQGHAQDLSDLLTGKQVDVGNGPPLDANDANAAKKMYDQLAKRPAGAMWSTGEAAKAAEMGQKADQLRGAIEDVAPGAKDINSDMQREIKLRSYLGKGAQRAPIQTLTTSSPDKQAILSEAARRAGTDIDQFAADSRLAKSLTFRPSDLSHLGFGTALKAGGRGLLEGLSAADVPAQLLKDPVALSALLSAVQTPDK